eukprot:6193528-Pleurochrysis_carterae.AAC.1
MSRKALEEVAQAWGVVNFDNESALWRWNTRFQFHVASPGACALLGRGRAASAVLGLRGVPVAWQTAPPDGQPSHTRKTAACLSCQTAQVYPPCCAPPQAARVD